MPVKPKIATALPNRQPILSEIEQLVRGRSQSEHMAVLATGASFAEIEQALVYHQGGQEMLGEAPHPLEGRAARVYEILSSYEAVDENE